MIFLNPQNLLEESKKKLSKFYDEKEINAIFHIVLQCLLGENYKAYHTEIPESELPRIKKYLSRLEKCEPIQYIIGEVEFLDCKLKVNPAVLIPRPETEWIVNEIIEEIKNRPPLNIIDIGCGSGCIPIAIKKECPQHNLWAIEKSNKALQTAQLNAKQNNTEICFKQYDISLEDNLLPDIIFDVIISNPPYIPNKEKNDLPNNVKNFEPTMALFVNDDDPTYFYKTIIQRIQKHQKQSFQFYFEIHAELSNTVSKTLVQEGISGFKIRNDLADRPRLICGKT